MWESECSIHESWIAAANSLNNSISNRGLTGVHQHLCLRFPLGIGWTARSTRNRPSARAWTTTTVHIHHSQTTPATPQLPFSAPSPQAEVDRKERQKEAKRTRLDKGQLEALLFQLFERSPRWTFAQLVKETNQPHMFLKEVGAREGVCEGMCHQGVRPCVDRTGLHWQHQAPSRSALQRLWSASHCARPVHSRWVGGGSRAGAGKTRTASVRLAGPTGHGGACCARPQVVNGIAEMTKVGMNKDYYELKKVSAVVKFMLPC